MFGLIAVAIEQVISQLIQIAAKSLSNLTFKKRAILVYFIELFDALVKLEDASKNAYEEFSGYMDGTNIPIKGIVRKKLDALASALQEFVKKFRQIETELDIYDHILGAYFRKAILSKSYNLEFIDVLLELSPRQVQKNKIGTYLVKYSTELPSASLLVNRRARSQRDIEQLKRLRKRIKNSLKKRTIDLSIPSEAQIALVQGKENIQQITTMRMKLADFIKQNFQLSDVLK